MQAAAVEQAIQALDANRPAEAERALARAPKTSLAWALLARTYFALGKPAEAAAAARQADAATDPAAQHTLALYYAQSGNRKRAAELERKFALSPQADPAAPARAAFLLAETGDPAGALTMGERALTVQDRPELRRLLARLYENARQHERALAHHAALVKARSYDEEALGEYGQALLRMGRFQQAVQVLEEGRRTFDKSPQVELALGVAYYSQRRFDEAAARFLRVIELDATVPQPYVFLSRMLDQIGPRLAEVRPLFAAWHAAERASHLPPLVLAKSLPAGERRALLAESIRREPKYWESHFELALVLEDARDWAAAARELETAARLDASQAQVFYRLARAYDRLGRSADAARARAAHAKLTAGEPGTGGGMGQRP